jgi:hypothetical protein
MRVTIANRDAFGHANSIADRDAGEPFQKRLMIDITTTMDKTRASVYGHRTSGVDR